LDELELSILSSAELERLHAFTSDRRKIEFYYTRLLWKEFGYDEFIQYGPEGNPIITEGQIGVSHSRHNIVIGHSLTSAVGIDIENYTPKVLRVASKFMSDSEIARFGTSDLKILTTIWSIKEAVYKMRYRDHLIFRDQIEVLEINKSANFRIQDKETVEEISFEIIELEDTVITFCLSNH